ncbi:creatininase family protein [Hoeflea prorocentri]|uniref:Creatininase family protein n=1 Tax=Hoeflea prorocentri TaxID=1922333 RepID=A0A9X3UMW5_9HYPH|nr:creatininase family protein [Hoeflea prorocentri]MCY6382129.1 creatininase family protein [Hoeflea prorocentri]MDA5399929.1 creatininase family protein [Hoeflea prorocentri]
MAEVEWARLKAHELRELATQDSVVILPVASIEQHGPQLPVMTDTRIGHEVAVRAARRAYEKRPTLVTPVVWHGLSEHHMPFGGTLILSHETFRLVLRDLVTSLSRHGFRDILISNSHGGNIMAMQQFCDEYAPQLDVTLVATTYAYEAAAAIDELLEDQDSLQHACEGETSAMMALEPDLVDTAHLSEIGTMADLKFLSAGRHSYRWRPFVHQTGDGVAGKPASASAAKGEAILEVSADALAAMIVDPATWAPPGDRRGEGTAGIPFRDRR